MICMLCPISFLEYCDIILPYCYKFKVLSPTSTTSVHLRVMLSHALHIGASECVFVPQWLVLVASLFLFCVCRGSLFFCVNSFLAAAAGLRRAKFTDRLALSALFLRGSPLGVRLKGQMDGLQKGFYAPEKELCVRLSAPKDVLLLIQKPSIAPSPQWVSHLLTSNRGSFQLSQSLCAVL